MSPKPNGFTSTLRDPMTGVGGVVMLKWVLAAVLAFAFQAKASEILSCTTCTTQQAFDAYAEATVSGRSTGQYQFTIVNFDQEIAYEVYVSKEYDLELHQLMVYIESDPSAPQVISDVQEVKAAVAKAEEVMPILPGEGTNNFGTHTREMVGAQIAASDWFQTLTKPFKRGLWNAWKQAGETLELVVIFDNGDVAVFTVHPANTAATCCEYKLGTARDINGNAIDDSGFGGTGAEVGGDYVTRESPNPTWGTRLAIHLNDLYRTCWRQGNGPWTCSTTP